MRLALAVASLGVLALVARPTHAQANVGPGVRLELGTTEEPQLFLDRPGYVAVFEFVTGRGVAQLYPLTRFEPTMRLDQGYRQLSPARADMARRLSYRASAAIRTFTPGRFGDLATAPAPWAPAARRFLPGRTVVAVASDRPLLVGAPHETLSRLHLGMPTLWTPASFESTTDDLDALVETIRAPGSAVSVTLMELPMPVYTMVMYATSPWLDVPVGTSAAEGDGDTWAICLGQVMRVPRWYLGDQTCLPGASQRTASATVASRSTVTDSIGFAPFSTTRATTSSVASRPIGELGPDPVQWPREGAPPRDAQGTAREAARGSTITDTRAGANAGPAKSPPR
jgi:hypothetical protein